MDKRARAKVRPVEPRRDSRESKSSTGCDAPKWQGRKNKSQNKTMEDSIERPESGDELTSNIRRLTTVMLEKLEEDSKARTIDHTQMRLMGAITLRALRLWEKTLRSNGKPAKQASYKVQELTEQVHAILGENMEETKKDEE